MIFNLIINNFLVIISKYQMKKLEHLKILKSQKKLTQKENQKNLEVDQNPRNHQKIPLQKLINSIKEIRNILI